MKNKILVFILAFITIALFTSEKLQAQITSESNSTYIKLDSYKGSTTFNAFRFSINLENPNHNYPDWSLVVRSNPPISNGEGKTFDPSKISIRINKISGGLTLPQIGGNRTPIPLSFSDVYLINRSNFPIQNGPNEYYKKYTFEFDILIEGGQYLENLKSYNEYWMTLIFSVLGGDEKVVTYSTSAVQMQIYPTGTPPSGPTYGIEVNSNARNGLLEFSTISDYINGVSQTYENGLSIISETPYQVQVRSLSSNFEANNNTLPINTVNLEIKDPKNSGVSGTITLSESLQSVINATNSDKKARLFHLRYFTKPNDERMIKAKPDSYTTTLMYTLIPQ